MSENLDLIVKERAEKWLSDSYDEETRKKVKQLIDNDPKSLPKVFIKIWSSARAACGESWESARTG